MRIMNYCYFYYREIDFSAFIDFELETTTRVWIGPNESDFFAGASKALTSTEPPRLLVLSNRVKFTQVMQAAVLPNVRVVYFKHDQCDLDGILSEYLLCLTWPSVYHW